MDVPQEDPIVSEVPNKPKEKEIPSPVVEEAPSPAKEPTSPTEFLYKPSSDPFQQSNKTVKSTFIEESAYNDILHKSKDLEQRNGELEQKNKELEQQLKELTDKLAE